ncbi:MAG: NADH-quinone oxidoreductase subunit NuoH [Candidatus Thermoplasmatota archaeon]
MNLYESLRQFIILVYDLIISILDPILPDSTVGFLNQIFNFLLHPIVILAEVIIIIAIVFLNVITLIWLERKIIGRMQDRRATMLGFMGIGRGCGYIQQIADGLKLFLKEDTTPKKADKICFLLCPVLITALSLIVVGIIPMSEGFCIGNLDGGLLFALAVFAFCPFAVFIGGWAGNNKYTLIGGMRSAAQMIGAEVPLILSVIGVVLIAGTLSFVDIVKAQERLWFIFLQPIGFIVFMIAMIAELERIPFDLPEAEAELIEGWTTEYSGMKFGLIMVGEYIKGYAGCAIGVLVFLGGWNGPILPHEIWFLLKVYILFIILIWIRAALPRVRIDQLLNLSWRGYLLPLAFINILLASVSLIIFEMVVK